MPARRVVAAAVSLAAASLLSACDKPAPAITLLSGNTVSRVDPQRWCFDATHACRVGSNDLQTIRATAGSTILVDVPQVVARQHWLVSAYTLDAAAKQTPVDGAGSSLLSDRHSVRVTVASSLLGGSYFLAVSSLDGALGTGLWGVVVAVQN